VSWILPDKDFLNDIWDGSASGFAQFGDLELSNHIEGKQLFQNRKLF
jgi:hypothetical protein